MTYTANPCMGGEEPSKRCEAWAIFEFESTTSSFNLYERIGERCLVAGQNGQPEGGIILPSQRLDVLYPVAQVTPAQDRLGERDLRVYMALALRQFSQLYPNLPAKFGFHASALRDPTIWIEGEAAVDNTSSRKGLEKLVFTGDNGKLVV